MEFLGLKLNPVNMTLYLPEEKMIILTNLCENILIGKRLSLRKLTSLVVPVLSSQAVLPELFNDVYCK